MQIGIRAHDCIGPTFEELISNIKGQDLKCIQLALGKAITEFPTDKCAMTPGLALYIKKVLAKNDVDVAVLGCYLNLGTPDKQQLAETTEIYKSHIRFASLLGCGMVGTETGAVNTTYSYEEANSSDEALEIFINNLRPVVEYAEKLGVIVAIECVWTHIACNVKRMRKVLDAINSPNLQVIYDPINTFKPGSDLDQEAMMNEAFELLGDDIAAIHIKDFVIKDGRIVQAPMGEGIFRFDVLMKWIKEKKPHIHVLMEDTKPENSIKSRDFVLEQYAKA